MNDTFPVPSDAYLAFDGLTIRDKIRQRLTQTGVFTDQNFEGSNLSAINDVIAMVFSLLIYNLNKTSSNGNFSETTLYKSMNGIVKSLSYNPIGSQTASVNFTLSAQGLPAGFYTIPRYSSIAVAGINYSLNDDLTFSKLVDTTLEQIIDLANSKIMYQGTFMEYPTVLSAGIPNETIFLVTDTSILVDHFNLFVYVKEPNGIWTKWNRTASLFLNSATDKVFEVRYNENKRYEIKLGNNINGYQPSTNSQIAIYYLASDGPNGEIGKNTITYKKMSILDTSRLAEILTDEQVGNILGNSDVSSSLLFDNASPSTYYSEPETVAQIRANAPANYRSQFSLTTETSYQTFLKTNFANILHDVHVMNNVDYLDSYIQYFYNLGLTNPQLEYRALYNQINYSDSCNFNNIYCFCVPKTRSNTRSYVFPAQKSLIINTIQREKVMTAEVIIADPVYMAIDFAASATGEPTVKDISNTNIIIYKDPITRKSDATIASNVNDLIVSFFDRINNTLGQKININQLVTDILALDGVQKIATQINDVGTTIEGLQLMMWNPLYPSFVTKFGANITLENFQFPFLYSSSLLSRITVI